MIYRMKCSRCGYEYSVDIIREYEKEICPMCGKVDDFQNFRQLGEEKG